MTQPTASYRRILKSSSIIGGASVLNVVIGLVRTKVLAVLLGPVGVGLVSLYRGLLTAASTVATMGIDTVGARQIAEAVGHDDPRALAAARRAMFLAAIFLAVAGTLAVWALRRTLALRVLGNPSHSAIVGWLSLGVAFTVLGAVEGAFIQGMRQIGDMARMTVWGAILNTVFGIAIIWRWRMAGLVVYVLVGPLATFLLGYFYASRLPRPGLFSPSLRQMTGHWAMLVRVGAAFMGGALAMSLIQLWIRVDVGNVLGARALGQFQAAWTISTQYIGFVLAAMAADYYPRLTGVMRDRNAASSLVNEQTEIALLLSGPVFIAMMALAPWVVKLLYTSAFAPAVAVLRWQILSDVLKIAAWPLGFIFLAAGDGKTFFWTETSALLLMGLLIAALLRPVGLEITGISYLACYVFYLPLVYWLARRRIAFHWSPSVVRLLTVTFAVCAAVGILVSYVPGGVGIGIGCLVAIFFAIHAIGRLAHMSDLSGPAGHIGSLARKLTARIG